MNFKIRNIIPIGFAVLLASCSQQQARRPLTQKFRTVHERIHEQKYQVNC